MRKTMVMIVMLITASLFAQKNDVSVMTFNASKSMDKETQEILTYEIASSISMEHKSERIIVRVGTSKHSYIAIYETYRQIDYSDESCMEVTLSNLDNGQRASMTTCPSGLVYLADEDYIYLFYNK